MVLWNVQMQKGLWKGHIHSKGVAICPWHKAFFVSFYDAILQKQQPGSQLLKQAYAELFVPQHYADKVSHIWNVTFRAQRATCGFNPSKRRRQ